MSNVLAPPLTGSRTGTEPTRGELQARVAPFARADSWLGYRSFVIDVAIYVVGLAGVAAFDGWLTKIACGVVAGVGLIKLGSLSHEAAHRAVVRSRLGNKIIAVVSMTLILFNYRLWIYDHHVLHHGRTNVKHNNFLSPITWAEYRAMPRLRRAIYRAYHSPSGAGILLYFLLERWPTVHLFPGRALPSRFRASAWRYSTLLAVYAGALLSLLTVASAGSAVGSVVAGFVLPLLMWYTTFSMTVFLQHSNPRLRWYSDVASLGAPPEALSMHVVMPHWINHATHYAMEHPVHHLCALIPHYHLKQAQAALSGALEGQVVAMRYTIGNMRDVLRRCRLYDYREHAWLDFNGQVTALPPDTGKPRTSPAGWSDDLLPDQATPGSPGIFFPSNSADAVTPPADSVTREQA